MAIDLFKWELVVSIADNSGKTVNRTYNISSEIAEDYDAFITLVDDLVTKLNAMTSGLITSYRATGVYIEDTITLPASGVENENQAFFSGKIQGDPTDSATQSIPAADPAIFVATSGPGANVVDMADAAVVAWIGLFDGAPGWTISDGETWLTPTVAGKRRHSKSSNS